MINLYELSTCPYCKKVLEFLDENSIPYELKDINEQENFDKMMKLGGKRQVPFIHDTTASKTMYESDAIINYLKKNYV